MVEIRRIGSYTYIFNIEECYYWDSEPSPRNSHYIPSEEKYRIMREEILANIDIVERMAFRDICCMRSDELSTAGIGLSLRFTVYSWGDCIENMEEKENLLWFYSKNVAQLPLEEKPNEKSLGEWATVSTIDPCGLMDEDFTMNVAEHSRLTILTIPIQVARCIGRKKGQLFGNDRPCGIGTTYIPYVDILLKEGKRRGFKCWKRRYDSGDHLLFFLNQNI